VGGFKIGMVGFKNPLSALYKSGDFKIGKWWALKTRYRPPTNQEVLR